MDDSMLSDEEDEFEDAEEGPVTAELSHEKQMKNLATAIISDCDEERIALPCIRDPRIKAGAMWSILKDMVGKDITKYSMPVIVNEPLSVLQKTSEICQFNHLLAQAAQEKDSLMRLVYVTAFQAARQYCLVGRFQKPFNPLLGETFELVTPKYRALTE